MNDITWQTTDLDLARIKGILGADYVDRLLRLVPSYVASHARCRATGAWMANEREHYAAYRSLARIVSERA